MEERRETYTRYILDTYRGCLVLFYVIMEFVFCLPPFSVGGSGTHLGAILEDVTHYGLAGSSTFLPLSIRGALFITSLRTSLLL